MTVENLQERRNKNSTPELKNGHQGGVVMPYSFPRRSFGRQNNEPDPINWRRGMFRVWLLLSAAWIMAWIIYLVLYGLRAGFTGPGDIMVIPILLLGPPFALLLFGMAAGWAFRGFNVENKSNPE
jgi:hypothetical protein